MRVSLVVQFHACDMMGALAGYVAFMRSVIGHFCSIP